MKTFNELFEEAVEINNNDLLVKIAKTEIIPAFGKAIEEYGYEKAFFTTRVKLFNTNSFGKENGSDLWAFAIDKNGHIWESKENLDGMYTVGNEIPLESIKFEQSKIFDFIVLLNDRIGYLYAIDFNESLDKRLNELNERYDGKIDELFK